MIEEFQQPLSPVQQCYLHSKCRKYSGVLGSDHTSAEDYQTLRDLFDIKNRGRIDDHFMIKGYILWISRLRTCSN